MGRPFLRRALLVVLGVCVGLPPLLASSGRGVRAIVLGIAQDGGVPHIGCRQDLCVRARRDCTRRQRVASLGLVDEVDGARFLIDATPDLPLQIEALPGAPSVRGQPVDGILLTHAHIGHYTGLMYLGREAAGARSVPVYATPRMAAFLRGNGPWNLLVAEGHIDLREMEPGRPVGLTPRLTVTPVRVPHRDELSDTVALRVEGPSRSLLYVPDIDKWEKWDRAVADEVARVDLALLDGTFYEASEIPGRSIADIPHPLVPETMDRLSAPRLAGKVVFIHLNHTNRLLWDPAALRRVRQRGFRVAREGQVERL